MDLNDYSLAEGLAFLANVADVFPNEDGDEDDDEVRLPVDYYLLGLIEELEPLVWRTLRAWAAYAARREAARDAAMAAYRATKTPEELADIDAASAAFVKAFMEGNEP